jgi:hypothetical protein
MLEIVEVLRTGYRRTVTQAGLTLSALFVVTGLLTSSFAQTVMEKLVPESAVQGAPAVTPLALPIDGPSAVLGLAAVYAASTVLGIVALRSMVSDVTGSIPRRFVTEGTGYAFLNTVIGGIAFSLILLVGFILLVFPGLYLFAALYFWTVFVAVEGENFVEALRSSWELTSGNRLGVFILLLVLVSISAAASGLAGYGLSQISPVAGELASVVFGGFVATFTVASVADAYNRLSE